MNSLFEFQTGKADMARFMQSFIAKKYLSKAFINPNELRSNENYLENLNKLLGLEGICIPIVIYNLFLGANLNYAKGQQTIVDLARADPDKLTETFLAFTEARAYQEIDTSLLASVFVGESVQIYDMNPTIHSLAAISSLPNGTVCLKLGNEINCCSWIFAYSQELLLDSSLARQVQCRNSTVFLVKMTKSMKITLNNVKLLKYLIVSTKNKQDKITYRFLPVFSVIFPYTEEDKFFFQKVFLQSKKLMLLML